MLSDRQRQELNRYSRAHRLPGMRLKALAVRAVALGHTRSEVGAILNVSAYSVGQWCKAYQERGWDGLQIAPGRGRHSRVDPAQIREYVLQSPRNFGHSQTRWTLQLLAGTVPCLAGLQPSAVWHALHRLGISYKRAEPWLHSPDPDYLKKNATSKPSSNKRAKNPKR